MPVHPADDGTVLMIVKGRSRGDGGQLAEYLLNFEKNENVMVLETAVYHDNEVLAIHESLTGFDYVTGLTKGTKGLYHAQVSPEAHEANRALESADWIRAADILGEKLGLEAQPRVLVLHEKDGKMHAHVVWQRTDTERGILISDSNNYAKHEYASRADGRRIRPPLGARPIHRPRPRPRERSVSGPRPGHDSQTQTYQPKNHDHAATQQAERTKMSPQTRKAEIAALWRQSDSGQAFVAAIHQAGYELVQGDAKPIHMLAKDGELYDLRRSMRGIKKDEYPRATCGVPGASFAFCGRDGRASTGARSKRASIGPRAGQPGCPDAGIQHRPCRAAPTAGAGPCPHGAV